MTTPKDTAQWTVEWSGRVPIFVHDGRADPIEDVLDALNRAGATPESSMTVSTGWWCPNCGHTVDAPVADQPDPEAPCRSCGGTGEMQNWDSGGSWWLPCPDCGPVGVPVGDDTPVDDRNIAGLYPPGRCSLCGSPTPDPEKQDVCDDCHVPVGDDTPAPTVMWARPQDVRPRNVTATGSESHRTITVRVDRRDDYHTVPLRVGATPDLTAPQLAEAIERFLAPQRCTTPEGFGGSRPGAHCAACCMGTGWATPGTHEELEAARALDIALHRLRAALVRSAQNDTDGGTDE